MFIAVNPEKNGVTFDKIHKALIGRGREFVEQNKLIDQFINYCSKYTWIL